MKPERDIILLSVRHEGKIYREGKEGVKKLIVVSHEPLVVNAHMHDNSFLLLSGTMSLHYRIQGGTE